MESPIRLEQAIWLCFACQHWCEQESKERTNCKELCRGVQCNTREYEAICGNRDGASIRKTELEEERGHAVKEELYSFSTIDAQRAMLRE